MSVQCNEFQTSLLSQTCWSSSGSFDTTAQIQGDNCYNLLTEQQFTVGQVCLDLDYSNDELNVYYQHMSYDWDIEEMQLWVGGDRDGYPKTNRGHPDVSQFPYQRNRRVENANFAIPIDDADDRGCLSNLCQYCKGRTEDETSLYLLVHGVISQNGRTSHVWADGKPIRNNGDFGKATRAEVIIGMNCDKYTATPSPVSRSWWTNDPNKDTRNPTASPTWFSSRGGIQSLTAVVGNYESISNRNLPMNVVYQGKQYTCDLKRSNSRGKYDCSKFRVSKLDSVPNKYRSMIVLGFDNSDPIQQIVVDYVLLKTNSGVTYTVDSHCIDDDYTIGKYYSTFKERDDGTCNYGSSRYRSLCIDNQSPSRKESCYPGQQYLYFKESSRSSRITDAEWKPTSFFEDDKAIDFLEITVGDQAGKSGSKVVFQVWYKDAMYTCDLRLYQTRRKYVCNDFEMSRFNRNGQDSSEVVIAVDNAKSDDSVVIDFMKLMTTSGSEYSIGSFCMDDDFEIGKYYSNYANGYSRCPRGSTRYQSMCLNNQKPWRSDSCHPGKQFLRFDQSDTIWSDSYPKDDNNAVESLQITVGAAPGGTTAKIGFKVFYDQKLYECDLYPSQSGKQYKCDRFKVKDCYLQNGNKQEAILSIDNSDSSDALVIDSAKLVIDGKSYGIQGVCVHNGDLIGDFYDRNLKVTGGRCPRGATQYSGVCVDNEMSSKSGSCYPSRQSVYFDMDSSAAWDSYASWSAGDIICDA